jgi:hypothetical protein
MSDPYIDRKFGAIVAPQVYRKVSENLSRYLDAAPRHEVSDRAAAYVMTKLWVDDERYRGRVAEIYGVADGEQPPPQPPVAPPSA